MAPVCFVGSKPSLLDILRLVVPTIAAKWEEVGQALGVERAILNTVRHSEQRVEGHALELLALWSQSAAGTGSQPRTWHSLLVAVEKVIGHRQSDRLKAKLQTLSPLSAFDESCQEIVSVCVYCVGVYIVDSASIDLYPSAVSGCVHSIK